MSRKSLQLRPMKTEAFHFVNLDKAVPHMVTQFPPCSLRLDDLTVFSRP